MKKIFLIVFLSAAIGYGQSTDELDKEAILSVIKKQEIAWNNYDLEGFMDGYWKSDSLQFFGSNGVTYGWNNTLSRYKKAYPSQDYSGSLKFTIHEVSRIDEGAYFVMGEYYLIRNVGNTNGIFMIILKKIDGDWKIIADTSA